MTWTAEDYHRAKPRRGTEPPGSPRWQFAAAVTLVAVLGLLLARLLVL